MLLLNIIVEVGFSSEVVFKALIQGSLLGLRESHLASSRFHEIL